MCHRPPFCCAPFDMSHRLRCNTFSQRTFLDPAVCCVNAKETCMRKLTSAFSVYSACILLVVLPIVYAHNHSLTSNLRKSSTLLVSISSLFTAKTSLFLRGTSHFNRNPSLNFPHSSLTFSMFFSMILCI